MGAAFSPAFLAGEARARAFLSDDFLEPLARRTRVQRAAERVVSARTLAALRELSARLPESPAREAHLTQLGRPGTAVVVTGQQVGLFTGPLYAFYKAASCIAVARTLSAETGVPCVPVFWLQSEDHDFAEIGHCVVADQAGALRRLQVSVPEAELGRSVSSLRLGQDVEAALSELATAFDGLPYAAEALRLVRTHYQPGRGFVEAFAGVLAEVFREEGLVFVDPRAKALVDEVRPLHERAVLEEPQLSNLLLARVAALEEAGFEAQVKVRLGVPLSFVHEGGFDGPRQRARPEHPDAVFSSSALLRPIVQDTLLPTAAIVGGPGELNYFAQVGPLYDHFGLPMPMLVPRARFRVVDARARALLETLGRTAAQLEAPRAQVLEALAPPDGAPSAKALEAQLLAAIAPVLEQVPADPRLGDALERTRKSLARNISRFGSRYARARAERDEVRVSRVERLQQVLLPDGAPQERVLSLPSMVARYGLQAFKALTFGKLAPFSTVVQELQP
jgi:uncharacterized protein YllA (UPF0747 family)